MFLDSKIKTCYLQIVVSFEYLHHSEKSETNIWNNRSTNDF